MRGDGDGWTLLLVVTGLLGMAATNYPVFDTNAQMRLLLVPMDARIGSVIYRLRATDSDHDYPLVFSATDFGSYVVRVESLECNRTSSFCEANVFLDRRLSGGEVFKFRVTVRDSNGDTTTSPATLRVTRASTDFDFTFPHVPGVVTVPESIPVGTELEYVIVRKHPRSIRPAVLELTGSDLFAFEQNPKKDTTTGIIKLIAPLDYEKVTMYKLNVFAMGMFVDIGTDSRNIAGFPVVVVVTDIQDTPPIWDHIEPVTKINPNISVGELILKVTAWDGDKGSPRPIKYGLVSENNPFTVFFSIDRDNGEIRLARAIKELRGISHANEPLLLTVIAEEVAPPNGQPPAMTSTATVALLLDQQPSNTPPYFHNDKYVTKLDENSPQGTFLTFDPPYVPEVRDDDSGKHKVFSLELVDNNGTFEISPTFGEGMVRFTISVRDNRLLDYETDKLVSMKILVKDVALDEGPLLSSSATVFVFLNDINDNHPVFLQSNYSVTIPENITNGFEVIKVEAKDVDTGDGGVVYYTNILGPNNGSLNLDPVSGMISVSGNEHAFDREVSREYYFQVEARDMKGKGNVARVPLMIEVLDINDNAPKFDRSPFEFILGQDGTNFSQRAFIKAVDNDAEAPNNVVRYEIVKGNYGDRFKLDSETGELQVNNDARLARQQSARTIVILLVRAYDMGVPTRWSEATVHVYPPDPGARVMRFIVPGSQPDRIALEKMLGDLTGGRVLIHSITPYNGQSTHQASTTDLTNGNAYSEKSVVTATVLYKDNAIIDVDKIQTNLSKNRTITSSPSPVTGQPTYATSESTYVLWALVALLFLLILLFLLCLCCCLCSCCPLYTYWQRKKIPLLKEVEHNISYISGGKERENKSIQAGWNDSSGRKEAWSGDSSRVWGRGRRNEDQQVFLVAPVAANAHRRQPSYVLSQEVMGSIRNRGHHDLILEDTDGTEYRIVDPSMLRTVRGMDRDDESMRRHEYDRGSDRLEPNEEVASIYQGRPPTRDPMFIKEGGAEIMVLQTPGRDNDASEPMLNQPERPFTKEDLMVSSGKEDILRRFIESQDAASSTRADQEFHGHDDDDTGREHGVESNIEANDAFQRILNNRESNLTTADVNRLTTIQRDLLLARFLVEEQKRLMNRSVVEDTQSLPGVSAMGTQTDVETGTQTDRIYFVKRRAKSDNDDSLSEGEESYPLRKKYKKSRKTIVVVDPNSVRPRRNRRLCEKMKSPILEESENVDIVNGFIPTKTSIMRHAATRAKFSLEDDANNRIIPTKGRKEEFYIMKSMSDQDLHSISKHREGVLNSLERTHIQKINIPHNVHNESVLFDEPRSKSSMSTHNYDYDDFLQNSLNEELSSINKSSNHRYLNDTVASQARKSPVRFRKEQQPRYMDWYKTKKEEREKRKRMDIVKTKPKSNSRKVPKRQSIKQADYEQIKRELMKSTRSPRAFTVQNDESTEEVSMKIEDEDSGIAMPFASLPPAITAVTLSVGEQANGDSNDELEEAGLTDKSESLAEPNQIPEIEKINKEEQIIPEADSLKT